MPPPAPTPWTENAADPQQLIPWREIWAARELVGFFALRDLRVRYKQAVLGVAWVVIQPLITVAAFTLVFDRIASVESGELPYPVFALAGLLGWSYMAQGITKGSQVLVSNPSLITKVYFPRIVAPVSSLLPGLVDLSVGLVLLAALCAFYGVVPGLTLLLLPLWLLLLMLIALSAVLFLAAANVRYRDVGQLVTPMLQALLFLSPVAYSAASLEGAARVVYSLNPAVGALELGRFVLVGGPWPGWTLAISLAVVPLAIAVGLVYFQRAQRYFADVI